MARLLEATPLIYRKRRKMSSTERLFSTPPREHFPSFSPQPQGPQAITLCSVVLGTAQALGGERITLQSVVLDKGMWISYLPCV